MFREKVISTKVSITNQEMAYFPIRLPDNATRIIGVEYGVRIIDGYSGPGAATGHSESFFLPPPVTVGNLRLQHPGCSGLFYATPVKAPDAMVGYGDFSASLLFFPLLFTHGFKRLEDPVEIPKQAKLVSAIYQNLNTIDAAYDLLVHVWYATEKGDVS